MPNAKCQIQMAKMVIVFWQMCVLWVNYKMYFPHMEKVGTTLFWIGLLWTKLVDDDPSVVGSWFAGLRPFISTSQVLARQVTIESIFLIFIFIVPQLAFAVGVPYVNPQSCTRNVWISYWRWKLEVLCIPIRGNVERFRCWGKKEKVPTMSLLFNSGHLRASKK